MAVALQHFRSKYARGLDTEDLATDFMEEEIGRHHWQRNWPRFKASFPNNEALLQRIRTWLDRLEIDHDPQAIVDHLNGMVGSLAGKWL